MTAGQPEAAQRDWANKRFRAKRAANNSSDLTASYALERIATTKAGLSESEQRVAQAIVDRPYDFLGWSAADLARESATSAATAVRTCRRLGFRGLNELRLTLARDLGWPPSAAPASRPRRASSLNELFDDASRSFQSMVTRDTTDAFKRAVEYLARARRVLVVAAGPSTVFAQDFVYQARIGGMGAEFWPDVIMQTLAASQLTRRDVCVAVSAVRGQRAHDRRRREGARAKHQAGRRHRLSPVASRGACHRGRRRRQPGLLDQEPGGGQLCGATADAAGPCHRRRKPRDRRRGGLAEHSRGLAPCPRPVRLPASRRTGEAAPTSERLSGASGHRLDAGHRRHEGRHVEGLVLHHCRDGAEVGLHLVSFDAVLDDADLVEAELH